MKSYWAPALCTILLASGVAIDAHGQASVAQAHVAAAQDAVSPLRRLHRCQAKAGHHELARSAGGIGKLIAFGPRKLSFRAFNMKCHEPVDVIFADKRIRVARLSRPHGIELLKSVIVLRVNVDDRIYGGFILDILESLRRRDVGLAHGLHIGEHLDPFLHESHEVTAQHACHMPLGPVS